MNTIVGKAGKRTNIAQGKDKKRGFKRIRRRKLVSEAVVWDMQYTTPHIPP